LVTGKLETVHVTMHRPFHYDPLYTDPIDIANRDQFVTVVERIVAHTPVKDNYKGQKVSEMEFKVRWKDLPESSDRYLPWKELRNNPHLHEYLAANNMKHLIPKEHRN